MLVIEPPLPTVDEVDKVPVRDAPVDDAPLDDVPIGVVADVPVDAGSSDGVPVNESKVDDTAEVSMTKPHCEPIIVIEIEVERVITMLW